jgi:hypothetical protein
MSESSIPPELAEWVAVRDEHIRHLEEKLSDVQTSAERQLAVTNDALARQKQEYVAYVSAYQHRTGVLQQEIQEWQSNYEQLRLQKGGFGFKALLAAAAASLVVGLLFGWLLFGHKDPQTVVFERFHNQVGFQVEYAMRQRQFDEAIKLVQQQANLGANVQIMPELNFLADLITSTKTGFIDAQLPIATAGYAMTPHVDTAVIQNEPHRLLTIMDAGVNLHTEARTGSGIISTLQKKDEVGQWDRTDVVEKVRLLSKGKPGVAEDYWYEVETATGQKGWVYGHFTNASLKRFRPDSIAPAPPRDSTLRDTTIKTQNR